MKILCLLSVLVCAVIHIATGILGDTGSHIQLIKALNDIGGIAWLVFVFTGLMVLFEEM